MRLRTRFGQINQAGPRGDIDGIGRSRGIAERLMACSFLALVVTAGGCDPDLGDWLDDQGGKGGSPAPRPDGGAVDAGGGAPNNPCAAALCPAGTRCEAQDVQCVKAPCPPVAVCVKVPPTACGPVCTIFCEYGNVLDANGCPTCKCNQPPPQPADPCATVRCAAGTHCEATPVQCVKAPCPPVASCVPDVPAVRCGGFAGIACPGAGVCADDPSDTCDPKSGGADCGGLCECPPAPVLCAKGTIFDASPVICACVPAPKPPVCGPVCFIFCEYGNVLDANGCPTCSCNPPPTAAVCPPEKCTGPAPKSPSTLCPDGRTTAGPACVVTAQGTCDWTILACPAN